MYRDAFDEAEGCYVCRFTPGGDPAEDYAKHLAGQRAAVAKICPAGKTMALLICQDPGFPPPDSVTRKQVAELTDQPDYKAVTAIVTQNLLIRGVVTAINWIRRRQQDETIHPNAVQGIAWLEGRIGHPLPQLRQAAKQLGIH